MSNTNTFTIDDAFASDEEDTIRTYGSTSESRMSPFRAKARPGSGRPPLQSALQSEKGKAIQRDKISCNVDD